MISNADQIRVLHLVGGKFFQGGTASVVRELIVGSRPGVQNWVWVGRDCPNESGLPLVQRGSSRIVSASPIGDLLGALCDLRRLLQTIEELNISVLHAHTRLGIFAGWLAHQISRVPLIIHLHFLANKRGLYVFLARTANAEVIYNSNRTREHYGAYRKSGHVVVPSLPWPTNHPPNSSSPRVVAASAFVANKRLDAVIEACSLLHARGTPTNVVVYGLLPGSIAPDTQQEILKQYGNLSFVTFAEWTSRWVDHLKAGDIFVHVSESESFGLTILEAFARGLKIVISRPSFLESFEPNICNKGVYYIADGTIDSVARAIQTALADPANAGELWRLRLTLDVQFSSRRAAEKVTAIYRSLAVRSKK